MLYIIYSEYYKLCLQCHPTLPVLATSGIEHTVKLWSPESAATPADPVDAAVRVRRNQERIMSGPQVLRSLSPRVFQVSHSSKALPENLFNIDLWCSAETVPLVVDVGDKSLAVQIVVCSGTMQAVCVLMVCYA